MFSLNWLLKEDWVSEWVSEQRQIGGKEEKSSDELNGANYRRRWWRRVSSLASENKTKHTSEIDGHS